MNGPNAHAGIMYNVYLEIYCISVDDNDSRPITLPLVHAPGVTFTDRKLNFLVITSIEE